MTSLEGNDWITSLLGAAIGFGPVSCGAAKPAMLRSIGRNANEIARDQFIRFSIQGYANGVKTHSRATRVCRLTATSAAVDKIMGSKIKVVRSHMTTARPSACII